MAYQLIYTSAAKLLDAGRSGFGTVARSKAITPLVVSAIERVSQFSNLRGNDRSRTIFVHRRIIAANNRIHLLSRICDAGADYTGRTHHIAHHLIVTQDEVARAAARGLTPADVLRQFEWLDRWDGAARFLGASDDVPLELFQPMDPHSTRGEWTRLTGNPVYARTLAWEGAPRTGVLLVPRGTDPLALMAEALCEFGAQSWSRTFTTALETTDEMSDLDWVVSSPENFAEIQSRCGARTILDLGQPQSLPVPTAPGAAPAQATRLHARQDVPGSGASDHAGPLSRQPGAMAVQVHIAQPGASAAGASRPHAYPKSKHKSKLLLVGVSAASLLILGLIVANLMKEHTGGLLAPRQKTVAKLSDAQEQAIRELEKIGFKADTARMMIAKAGPTYTSEWALFLSDSNILFQKLLNPVSPGAIASTLTFPQIPQSESLAGTQWTGTLVDIVKQLSVEGRGKDNDWIPKADRYRNQIQSIIHDHGLPMVESTTIDSGIGTTRSQSDLLADRIGKTLVLNFAAKRLDEVLTNPADGRLGVLLQDGGRKYFGRDNNRDCYELITSKISRALAGFARNDRDKFKCLCHEISAHKDLFGDDYQGLEVLAILDMEPNFNWDKLKQLSPEKQARVLTSKLVPDWIKNSLQQPSADSIPTQPAAGRNTPEVKPGGTKPALANQASAKQVILVLREQLKHGVEVAGMKAWLEDYPGDILKKEDLEISVGDVPFDKNLILVPRLGCFAETYIGKPGEIQIHKDGRVSIDRAEAGWIKLNCKRAGSTRVSILVVTDSPNPQPLAANLKFNIEPHGEDEALIKGELAGWLAAINFQHANDDRLLVPKFEPMALKLLLQPRAGEWHLIRPPLETPVMVFSAHQVKSVNDALDEYLKLTKKGNSTEAITNFNQSRLYALEKLRGELSQAIGGWLLAKELKMDSEDLIQERHWEVAKHTLETKFEIKRPSEFMPADETKATDDKQKDAIRTKNRTGKINDLKDILDKIGGRKLDEVLKNQGHEKDGWDQLIIKSEDAISKCIQTVMRNTKSPAPRKPLAEELTTIQSITVQTASGRVLFTATPN